MVDQDILSAKVASIQRCLKRIADVTQLSTKSLDSLDTQDIFVLNLQRAAQAAIDLAAHIIASQGLGLPGSLREHFTLLEQNEIITAELREKMIAMVGFRNIAVHEYQDINVAVIKSILDNNLQDFERYISSILEQFSV